MYNTKVGLIGLGSWGKNIYRNLYSLNILEKVYDNNINNLSNNYLNENIIAKSADDIILSKNIESIFIASPAITHKEYILRSLLNNKHVFVEKPLCLSLSDTEEIKKVSKNVNKIVFVGHLLQYHNAFKNLKRLVNLGKIGKVKVIKANRLNFGKVRQNESVHYDLTSHDISMILSVTKSLPENIDINAVFKNSKKIADYINVIMHFNNDIIAIINSDWISPYKEHRFSVLGSKGSLIFDDTKEWKNKLVLNQSYLNNRKEIINKTTKAISLNECEPLKFEIETFLNCVQNFVTPNTDIEEAINVQIVLDMIDKKIKNKYG